MKTSKTLFTIAALALTACAHATPVLLSENFDDISALTGWLLVNNSSPVGQSWFQGNAGIFPAANGPANAYIAANFLSADGGVGTVDNWLITPVITLSGLTSLQFSTRADNIPGFNDALEVRFSSGAGTALGGFSDLLAKIGGANPYPGDWQPFTRSVDGAGTGRFAFRYTGDAGTLNYIGIDAVTIAAVPEAPTLAVFGLGLAALGLRRRRQGAAAGLSDQPSAS